MVQTSEPRDLGIVLQCNAIDCTHNQSQQCMAGAIDIAFVDRLAQCYTYTEEPVLVKRVRMGAGDVSQCEVIDCIYNEGQRCEASSIAVTFLEGVARCATYTT